ncbi:MAG: DMT family transporter [Chloroflexota bacterium]|nr:DMT family transporter [Chloroflexota bacterium]
MIRVVAAPRFTVHHAAAAMLLSATLWGLGTVMSKGALERVPPMALLVAQLLASVSFLWIAVVARGVPTGLFRPRTLALGWTGILEPGLAYILGVIGLVRTSASSASLIAALEPVIVLVLAALFLHERPTRRTALLMGAAFVGVVLVSGAGDGAGHSLIGDALYFFGVVSAALYVIMSRKSVQTLDPLPLAALQQSAGLLTVLVAFLIALAAGESGSLTSVPLEGWLLAAVSGVVQFALPFVLYLTALKTLTAARAAVFLTLTPVVGVVASVLFLGELFTGIQIAGAALVIGALFGVNARSE